MDIKLNQKLTLKRKKITEPLSETRNKLTVPLPVLGIRSFPQLAITVRLPGHTS